MGACYEKGAVVQYNSCYYTAEGDVTNCEPGTMAPWLSYQLFSREGGHPRTSRLLLLLSVVQTLVMALQLVLLVRSLQWIPHAAGIFASVACQLQIRAICEQDQEEEVEAASR